MWPTDDGDRTIESTVREYPIASWASTVDPATRERMVDDLEDGRVILLPRLTFALDEDERRFLSPSWSDGRSKNMSLDPATGVLRGARGSSADIAALTTMAGRFQACGHRLVAALMPDAGPHLRVARTSFRPFPVTGRVSSWRKDDTRLHVDAFASRPTGGARILRVFCNVHPGGVPRVWRVGEPFERMARRFMPSVPWQLPGAATVMSMLGISRGRRTAYDHIMLNLHDLAKADAAYQREGPWLEVAFPAQSTWLVYSDQVVHAAVAGQFVLEQTLHHPVAMQRHPERAPLRILEMLAGRRLD